MATNNVPAMASMMLAEVQSYSEAAKLCESQRMLGPAQMLHALSIELMLKTAAQIECGSYLRTHDLVELFDQISNEARDAVFLANRKIVLVNEPSTDLDPDVAFRTRLGRIRRDFIDVRYLFEQLDDLGEIKWFEHALPIAAVIWSGLVPIFRRVPNASPFYPGFLPSDPV